MYSVLTGTYTGLRIMYSILSKPHEGYSVVVMDSAHAGRDIKWFHV